MANSKNVVKSKDVERFESWSLPDMNGPIANSNDSDQKRIHQTLRKTPQTASQLENIRKQAYKEGFEEGQKQGLEQFKVQSTSLKEKLIQVINKLQKPLAKIDKEVEEQLLQVCVMIAKQVIRRELKQEPEQIAAVIRECLKILPSSNTYPKIKLHPDDYQCVKEIYPNLEDPSDQGWVIIEDSSITPGGCIVDSDSSHIDATIESRINQISIDLLGGSRDDD